MNPLLSVVEDILSIALSIISIFAPLVVPVALALLAFALWKVVQRIRAAPTNAAAGSAP